MNRNFSKEEAQRIFSLAAERQQVRQSEVDEQLSLEDLEEAGLAAGIDPAFIRAAASDLLRPDRVTEQRNFLGLPVELRESHVLPIPYTEENWKQMVDRFCQVYNKPGVARELGTTRRWQSEANDNQMPTQIIAEKDEYGTRITIERKLWPLSLGFGISAVVNLLIGFIFFGIWMSVGTADEMIIPASIMLGIGALLGMIGSISTKSAGKAEHKRFEQIFSHLQSLAPENETSGSDTTPSTVGGVTSDTEKRIALDETEQAASDASPSRTRIKT